MPWRAGATALEKHNFSAFVRTSRLVRFLPSWLPYSFFFFPTTLPSKRERRRRHSPEESLPSAQNPRALGRLDRSDGCDHDASTCFSGQTPPRLAFLHDAFPSHPSTALISPRHPPLPPLHRLRKPAGSAKPRRPHAPTTGGSCFSFSLSLTCPACPAERSQTIFSPTCPSARERSQRETTTRTNRRGVRQKIRHPAAAALRPRLRRSRANSYRGATAP